ncbi:hypothetical protein B0H15DRAFT_185865 [Mycena belliarum]|uniref:Uncharacterized protein n=1 Tax=Mycena belliarum TaxID=1033014 RepID=A0AAD6UBL7_9AGAR|nr:hypothetical protein B0H15DRAFT_185865 [Mycena belliae]
MGLREMAVVGRREGWEGGRVYELGSFGGLWARTMLVGVACHMHHRPSACHLLPHPTSCHSSCSSPDPFGVRVILSLHAVLLPSLCPSSNSIYPLLPSSRPIIWTDRRRCRCPLSRITPGASPRRARAQRLHCGSAAGVYARRGASFVRARLSSFSPLQPFLHHLRSNPPPSGALFSHPLHSYSGISCAPPPSVRSVLAQPQIPSTHPHPAATGQHDGRRGNAHQVAPTRRALLPRAVLHQAGHTQVEVRIDDAAAGVARSRRTSGTRASRAGYGVVFGAKGPRTGAGRGDEDVYVYATVGKAGRVREGAHGEGCPGCARAEERVWWRWAGGRGHGEAGGAFVLGATRRGIGLGGHSLVVE